VAKKGYKNLNRGQVIGIGQSNMVWPGLNAPVLKGKEILERRQLPPDPERQAKLFKLRDQAQTFRVLKLNPLERGYSGTKMPGRSIGPPDPVGMDTFEDFDSRVVEMKTVCNMTALFGRRRRISAMVVVGNKNGLIGYGMGKSTDGRAALRRAKNRAIQRLISIDRCDGHTVFHDFFTRFGKTKLFVHKKPKGYGLVCHRVIKTICELIGITDLHTKREGSRHNVQHLVKAFLIGLLNQKTHQELAEEKGLHVVEFRKEKDYFPTVVASPTGRVRTEREIPRDEMMDFDLYVSNGRVELFRKKREPFFTRLPGWQTHIKKTHFKRNHGNIILHHLVEYGARESWVNKSNYPLVQTGIGAYPGPKAVSKYKEPQEESAEKT
jgi:small subunit ribosomal protein S5